MKTDKDTLSADGLVWAKSSYSGGEGGNCVEVSASPGTVHVRDSKDKQGPQLVFTATEWAAFVSYTVALQPSV